MKLTIPKGYQFAGIASGIKKNKLDLSLLVSDRDSAAAGVFTTNRVCAAPVHCCRRRVPSTTIRGVVINSGNANACTGEQGMRDAEEMTSQLAGRIGCDSNQILVCSTGVIGRPLPMPTVTAGIHSAHGQLAGDFNAATNAAHAIMTTDTHPKIAQRVIATADGEVRLLGIAKGAAMIGPNMATMLAFVLTDAKVDPPTLDRILRSAVDRSFHCISVEGHTSTNDTVLLLANGASGCTIAGESLAEFESAVTGVCAELAQAIARDAEGASHFVTIEVTGTRNDADARRIAKAVADSPLVKTAICGADPNWGRICSAAGYAGVAFVETDMSLRVNGTLLYDQGAPTPFDPVVESARLRSNHDTHIELLFSLGSGRCRFWTCDLTTEYVRLNADYTT